MMYEPDYRHLPEEHTMLHWVERGMFLKVNYEILYVLDIVCYHALEYRDSFRYDVYVLNMKTKTFEHKYFSTRNIITVIDEDTAKKILGEYEFEMAMNKTLPVYNEPYVNSLMNAFVSFFYNITHWK